MKLQSVELTHVGSVRSENQDSIFSLPDRGLYVVADGMGGEKAGAEASAQVIASVKGVVQDFFKKEAPKSPGPVEEMLRDALQKANNDVFEISVREPDKTGLGSTGSLLCLHKGVYFIAQVGDSRIYQMREGNIRLLTRDHTVVWALYENGVITRDQLETHPERHLLTQCVGGPKALNIDTFEGRLQEGDVFLICSDGLTGYAGEDKVFEILPQAESDLEKCGQALIQAALDGGGGDNVSVILVRVEKLTPEDNWMPEVTPTPRRLPMPNDEDITAQRPTGASARKSRLGLILGGVAVALAMIGVIVTTSLPKSITVPMRVIPPEGRSLDHSSTIIEVFDAQGQLLDDPLGPREADVYQLILPENGEYRLRISSAGIVPVEITRYISSNDKEPFPVETRPSGRLLLDIENAADVESITIRSLSGDGNANPDYAITAADLKGGLPTTFDLRPNEHYQAVVASKSSGATWRNDQIVLDPGQELKLTVKFDR